MVLGLSGGRRIYLLRAEVVRYWPSKPLIFFYSSSQSLFMFPISPSEFGFITIALSE